MDETIKELNQKLDSLLNEAKKVRNKLNEAKRKKELPALIETYKGKFFKYRNNYACPETESDYWFVYYKVTSVTLDNLVGVSLQMDSSGDLKISDEPYLPKTLLQDEITEIEFNEHAKGMIKSLQNKLWGKINK